jgi:uncharacterized membrane protein
MTTYEAVQQLSRRAQARARFLNLVMGLTLVGVAGLLFVAALLIAALVMGLNKLVIIGSAIGAAFVSVAAVVPAGRWFTRQSIARSREAWISELASNEGLNATELGEFFTLDSW